MLQFLPHKTDGQTSCLTRTDQNTDLHVTHGFRQKKLSWTAIWKWARQQLLILKFAYRTWGENFSDILSMFQTADEEAVSDHVDGTSRMFSVKACLQIKYCTPQYSLTGVTNHQTTAGIVHWHMTVRWRDIYVYIYKATACTPWHASILYAALVLEALPQNARQRRRGRVKEQCALHCPTVKSGGRIAYQNMGIQNWHKAVQSWHIVARNFVACSPPIASLQ